VAVPLGHSVGRPRGIGLAFGVGSAGSCRFGGQRAGRTVAVRLGLPVGKPVDCQGYSVGQNSQSLGAGGADSVEPWGIWVVLV